MRAPSAPKRKYFRPLLRLRTVPIETNYRERVFHHMRLSLDTFTIGLLTLGGIVLAGQAWLRDHPEHNPWAPLSLADPPGWATEFKFAELRDDRAICRAFLDRSKIDAKPLPPAGSGACRRDDRHLLYAPAQAEVMLVPRGAQATCAIDAGLAWWLRHGVQPAAQSILDSRVVRIEHFGTTNCRRIGGISNGQWSEHARGNAIDISAFALADGRRISVRADWKGAGAAPAFLHAVRDRACRSFATVLSPDYNAAHADHLHLDQAQRATGWRTCR